ncbi:MAG TPA: ribosome maturation factor RimP [Mycobacteriales bacterium]|nr:ribosome maturation factor RimP [Mycobacteriales bacterium]
MASGAAHRDRLATLVEPAVRAAGYDLEEVDVSRAGRRRVVRVVIDSDGGVSLDGVAEVSRAVSGVLDEHDDLLGQAPYVLEVSSPGVDRPLSEPRHWRRATGRRVLVPVDGRTVEARVVRADQGGVELDAGGRRSRHGYAELGPGRVQVEFGQADHRETAGPEPGGEEGS